MNANTICAKTGGVELIRLQNGYKVSVGLMVVGEYLTWKAACDAFIQMVGIANGTKP